VFWSKQKTKATKKTIIKKKQPQPHPPGTFQTARLPGFSGFDHVPYGHCNNGLEGRLSVTQSVTFPSAEEAGPSPFCRILFRKCLQSLLLFFATHLRF